MIAHRTDLPRTGALLWSAAMASGARSWFRRVMLAARFLVVALAMAGQVSGAMAAPDAARPSALTALRAAMILCQADHAPAKDGLPPVHHHLADPAIAGSGVPAVQPASLLDTAPALPAPSLRVVTWRNVAEARAPPALHADAAYPRGPPASS
jgi:hypothetical protein